MTLDSTSFEWFYEGDDLLVHPSERSLDTYTMVFKGGRLDMEMLAEKALESAVVESGARWNEWARQDFVRDFVKDEAQLKAYVLGAEPVFEYHEENRVDGAWQERSEVLV